MIIQVGIETISFAVKIAVIHYLSLVGCIRCEDVMLNSGILWCGCNSTY